MKREKKCKFVGGKERGRKKKRRWERCNLQKRSIEESIREKDREQEGGKRV